MIKALMVAAALTVAPGCITQHGDDTEENEDPPEETPSETATLRVENKSSSTVLHLYMWRCGEASNTIDQLKEKSITPGSALNLNGVPPGCWNLRAESSTLVWRTSQGVTIGTAGFTWQLFNGA